MLLLLAVVFFALEVWVYFATRRTLPPELQSYLRQRHPLTPHEKVLAVVLILTLLLWVVSFIGLFFFWPVSRPLFVALALLGFLVTPLLGPRVVSGWTGFLGDCAILLEVLIFFLIYFSPLKSSFVTKG